MNIYIYTYIHTQKELKVGALNKIHKLKKT